MDKQGLQLYSQLTRTEEALREAQATSGALERENAALRVIARAVLDNDWYRGNSNGADYCAWCHAAQEPIWKHAPARHAADCVYVAASVALADERGEAQKVDRHE
jgi:hypothetical protein